MVKIVLQAGLKAFVYQTRNREKFLLLKRAVPFAGEKITKWDIPGGRMNPGEPFLKAFERELTEETSLKLEKLEKVLAVQDILNVKNKHIVRITFLAQVSGSVKINPEEHTDFKWVTIKEIKKLDHNSYLTPVLGLLFSRFKKVPIFGKI